MGWTGSLVGFRDLVVLEILLGVYLVWRISWAGLEIVLGQRFG